MSEPWLPAATAMCPSTMKPSPPNIFFDVTPGSPVEQVVDALRQLLVVRHAASVGQTSDGTRLGAGGHPGPGR